MKFFNLNLYERKCKGSPSHPLHFSTDAAKLLPQACPTLLLVTVDIVVIQCITTWWRLSSHDWQVTPCLFFYHLCNGFFCVYTASVSSSNGW